MGLLGRCVAAALGVLCQQLGLATEGRVLERTFQALTRLLSTRTPACDKDPTRVEYLLGELRDKVGLHCAQHENARMASGRLSITRPGARARSHPQTIPSLSGPRLQELQGLLLKLKYFNDWTKTPLLMAFLATYARVDTPFKVHARTPPPRAAGPPTRADALAPSARMVRKHSRRTRRIPRGSCTACAWPRS